MSDAYAAHQEAVAAAKIAVGEVQDLLSGVTDRLGNETVRMVHYATGGLECHAESGRIAFEWTSGLSARVDEIYRITENIVAELDRYAGGF